jgi:hypothetical protein
MKFHNAGKFNGDVESLPKREHEDGAVMFKEPTDMTMFSIYMNIFAMVLMFVLTFLTSYIVGEFTFDTIGCLLALLCMVPHEYLHAICFKEDVYMYRNLKQGTMFVVGPENMSKFRFCFMSMFPCLILGIIPYVIFLINPSLVTLGTMGAISMASCAGDFYNVFNAITQMPKGAKTYLCGMNSYWYMPKENEGEVKEEKTK